MNDMSAGRLSECHGTAAGEIRQDGGHAAGLDIPAAYPVGVLAVTGNAAEFVTGGADQAFAAQFAEGLDQVTQRRGRSVRG